MAQAVEMPGRTTPRWTFQGGSSFLLAVLALSLLWILYKGSSNWSQFAQITTNGLTLAGLYFIVASGFTLIFGLMRVVNMAHGSLYMLGGVVTFLVQERFVGEGSGFGPPEANWGEFLLPLAIGTVIIALGGLLMQQLLLRWNQGQELRQALITIAISVIVADQTVARFGGISKEISLPESLPTSHDFPIIGQYGVPRLLVLGIAIVVGVGLVLLMKRTRFGMIVRAGVDDRQMVSALGVNIQRIFALAFLLGAFLAGLAGVLGSSITSVNKADDSKFLLISLVVVIVGGMGSLVGAAVGALLLGLLDSYGDIYLPASMRPYSVLLTFLLLVFVLAARPNGLFGRSA